MQRAVVIATAMVFSALLGSGFSGSVQAQSYPAKLIRVIVPFPPGGPADIIGRLTADYLDRSLNVRVLLEHRPGASCNIGSEAVAKAPPDGYTLGLINVGCVAINPWLFKNMPLDVLNDLVPVATIGNTVAVLFVNAELPVANVRELIAHAKQAKRKVNYASAGAGTPLHLNAVYFSRVTGVEMFHVPYKGMTPIISDLVTGRIQAVFVGAAAMFPQLRAGRVRALAVGHRTRLAALPHVPTFEEEGISGFEPISWWGLMAPRTTPAQIVATVNRHLSAMADDPEARKRLQEYAVEPIKDTPEEFSARVKRDYEKWGELVRAAGLKPE